MSPVAGQVVLRAAVPQDYSAIAELTVAAYIDGGHLQPDDSYLDQLRDVAPRAEHAELIVAEIAGQVAGSVTLTEHVGPYAEVSRPGEMEFRMLAVHPGFQGAGIARRLVRHVMEVAGRRPGVHSLTLCSVSTMTAAHQLYRSEGFCEDPSRDFILALPHKHARFPFFIRRL